MKAWPGYWIRTIAEHMALVQGARNRIMEWKPSFRSVPFYVMSNGDWFAPHPTPDQSWIYRGVEWSWSQLCAVYEPVAS